jgi:hypothetical protein
MLACGGATDGPGHAERKGPCLRSRSVLKDNELDGSLPELDSSWTALKTMYAAARRLAPLQAAPQLLSSTRRCVATAAMQ